MTQQEKLAASISRVGRTRGRLERHRWLCGPCRAGKACETAQPLEANVKSALSSLRALKISLPKEPKPKAGPLPKPCRTCSFEFQPTHNFQQYCSLFCRQHKHWRNPPRLCETDLPKLCSARDCSVLVSDQRPICSDHLPPFILNPE